MGDFATREERVRTVRWVMPWERAPICITVPSECSICKSSQQLVQIRQHVQFYSLYMQLWEGSVPGQMKLGQAEKLLNKNASVLQGMWK